jgi:hypothetical protein
MLAGGMERKAQHPPVLPSLTVFMNGGPELFGRSFEVRLLIRLHAFLTERSAHHNPYFKFKIDQKQPEKLTFFVRFWAESSEPRARRLAGGSSSSGLILGMSEAGRDQVICRE